MNTERALLSAAQTAVRMRRATNSSTRGRPPSPSSKKLPKVGGSCYVASRKASKAEPGCSHARLQEAGLHGSEVWVLGPLLGCTVHSAKAKASVLSVLLAGRTPPVRSLPGLQKRAARDSNKPMTMRSRRIRAKSETCCMCPAG